MLDERLAKLIDLAQFVREIDLKCWDRLARSSWRPFQEAREFARALKLKSANEWRAFCGGDMSQLGPLPADIPANPNSTYTEKGWRNWGDWLGTGKISDQLKQYRPFREARVFSRRLKLPSRAGWSDFCKRKNLPADIPATPWQTHADKGWKGMGDWLGTGTLAPRFRKYRLFSEARAFARRLKFESRTKWSAFCKGEILRLVKIHGNVNLIRSFFGAESVVYARD